MIPINCREFGVCLQKLQVCTYQTLERWRIYQPSLIKIVISLQNIVAYGSFVVRGTTITLTAAVLSNYTITGISKACSQLQVWSSCRFEKRRLGYRSSQTCRVLPRSDTRASNHCQHYLLVSNMISRALLYKVSVVEPNHSAEPHPCGSMSATSERCDEVVKERSQRRSGGQRGLQGSQPHGCRLCLQAAASCRLQRSCMELSVQLPPLLCITALRKLHHGQQ